MGNYPEQLKIIDGWTGQLVKRIDGETGELYLQLIDDGNSQNQNHKYNPDNLGYSFNSNTNNIKGNNSIKDNNDKQIY